jgi:CDP-diacylglycerol--serine O-phosphatidyltransferase
MRAQRPKKLSLHKLIPNMITLAALASGMSSVKFAIAERWELAVIAVIAAMFMDGFDGAAARLLKASSKLGAELDSLSDFVSFGVAPAIVVYLWSLQGIGRWGWFICLVYAIALGLRLARFNVMKEEDDAPDNPLNKYFTGVPAPVDALLCLLPMIVSFALDDHGTPGAWLRAPEVTGLWMLVTAGLAVSHIPTFSSKQVKVPWSMRVPALGLFGLMVAGLINDPWPTLTLIGAVYLALLPLSALHYARKAKAIASGHADPDDSDTDD